MAALVAALVLAPEAVACSCAGLPLGERFDQADAAAVGKVISERDTVLDGAPQRVLTFAVSQRVKGDLGRTIEIRSPRGSDCDLDVPRGRTVGLLLQETPRGAWLASACSVVAPGPLVAQGGEPRGGPIKVAVGFVILALVLGWAFWRLKRGKRPDLPGAPTP